MNKANESIAREIVVRNRYEIKKTTEGYHISLEWESKKYEEIIPRDLVIDAEVMNVMNDRFAKDFAIHLITKAIDNIGRKIDEADAERYQREVEEIYKNRGDGQDYNDKDGTK